MGTTDATPISIPYPDTTELHLHIFAGACQLRIRPGAGDSWVTGTYIDPSGRLPVRVQQESGRATIDHERNVGNLVGLLQGAPKLDLTLGSSRPYVLTIETGGSDNDLDLGSLPLQRCVLRQGAGRTELNFSSSNPEPMELLQVSAGAAGLTARGLANANAATMTLEGGAASYTFDFSGFLRRDSDVKISTGISTVAVTVPGATAATISSESFLSKVDVGDGFTKKAGAFWTQGAMAGHQPTLRIDTAVGVGLLTLRTTEQIPSGAIPSVVPEPSS